MYSPALTALNATPLPPTAGAPPAGDGPGFARLLQQAQEMQRPAPGEAAAAPAPGPAGTAPNAGPRAHGDAADATDEAQPARPATPARAAHPPATAGATRSGRPGTAGAPQPEDTAGRAPLTGTPTTAGPGAPAAGDGSGDADRPVDGGTVPSGTDARWSTVAAPGCAPVLPEAAVSATDAEAAGAGATHPQAHHHRHVAASPADRTPTTADLAAAGAMAGAARAGAAGPAATAQGAPELQPTAQAAGSGAAAATAAAADGSAGFASALAAAGTAAAPAAATATPTASARLAAEPGTAAFARELGTQVTTFVRNGLHHAVLELNPADMGPVTVQIQLDGMTAQVHLAADQAGTRHALAQAMPQLAGSLREAGLMLAGGGVFEQPRQGASNGDGSGGRDADGGSRRGAARGGSAAIEGTGVERVPPTAVRRGVVDLLA